MPFEGGLQGTANGTLLFATLLAAAYLFYGQRRTSPLKVAAKTLSVALLALLSWMEGGPWLLTLGLALCAAGDFFLAIEERNERFFAAGLVSFLAGHIAYIALFVALAGTAGFPRFAAIAIGGVLAAVSVAMAMRLWRAAGPLRIPVMIYIVAIFAMGLSALATGLAWVIAGAASFMASDTALAAERFLMKPDTPLRQLAAPFVWVSYFTAQVMILLGILNATGF
jgi:uncharacterized membrane protein YhhN